MEQVGTVKQRRLFIVDKSVEADRTVGLCTIDGLLAYSSPEIRQGLSCLLLLFHCEGAGLFLVIEGSLDIREE